MALISLGSMDTTGSYHARNIQIKSVLTFEFGDQILCEASPTHSIMAEENALERGVPKHELFECQGKIVVWEKVQDL